MNDFITPCYEYLESQRSGRSQKCNYASQCGHPCKRCLVYNRTQSDKRAMYSKETLMRFADGNLHEDSVFDLLRKAGFKVTQQQRSFEIKQINLTGHIDGFVEDVPCEVKSMSTNVYQKINSVEDILKHKYPYIRGYMAQLQMYLMGMEKEEGVFFLKDKNTSQFKQINVKLDYSYTEEIFKKLEDVERHIKAETLPDKIEDREVCKSCDFKAFCLPDENFDQIHIEKDEEVELLLAKYWLLKPHANEYEKINDTLKQVWKSKQNGDYLYGDFSVNVTTYKRVNYDIPKDVKEKYKTEIEITKSTVVNLKENENEE